jgi:hypothetical protein
LCFFGYLKSERSLFHFLNKPAIDNIKYELFFTLLVGYGARSFACGLARSLAFAASRILAVLNGRFNDCFYMFHHEPPIKPFNLEHYSIWNRRCKYTVSFGKKAKEAVKRRFQENTAKKKPRPAENNCF